jgi:chemotaxis family two-component system response regulator Rcp1
VTWVHSLGTMAHLGPGDHLCCIYETEEEHRTVLTPFLLQGLERNERVIYIAHARTAETVLGYLRDEGLGLGSYLTRRQLSVLTIDDTYMREGVFDPDGMIELLEAETERALADGYSALRVTGEMTWALRGLPGSERLIEYEAKLNDFFPTSSCIGLCQYHRREFDPAVLLNVLRTHPIALFGKEVYRNFYYCVSPAESNDGDLAAAELRRWAEIVDRPNWFDCLIPRRLRDEVQALVAKWVAGQEPVVDTGASGIPIDILMVEDNPGDVRLVTEALKHHGIHNNLHVARDGVEALAFLHREGGYADASRPGLILLDLDLPREDGREVLAQIKQDPDLKRIPVVILTTSQDEGDTLTAYDLHANCYVIKPIELDQIIKVVRAIEEFWLTVVELPMERGRS